MKTKPLFMWAGGKSKMLKHYSAIQRPKYSTYVEPFFGGGAMYLNERPHHAVLNDINFEIMSIYEAVRDSPDTFIAACMVWANQYFAAPDRKQFYYDLRQQYWDEQSPPLLYVLMKLGFNGIWQTCKDSHGLFGTPAGLLNHVRIDQIVNIPNIMEWHERLAGTELFSTDYRDVKVPENSFVFMDPPYRASYTTYGTGFSDVEQVQVIETALEWAEHSTVWLSNRSLDGDDFFERRLPGSKFFYFDVTYTAGRRKLTSQGFEALRASEFLCVVGR